MEILFGSLLSLIAGGITTLIRILEEEPRFWQWLEEHVPSWIPLLERLGIERPKPDETYREKVANLLQKFSDISLETDTIIGELESSLKSKTELVQQLENQHRELTKRIEELKENPEFGNIEILRRLERMERDQALESRRSALRDYGLFALGVLVPIVVAIIARLFGYSLPI